jgi:hypothetical protein
MPPTLKVEGDARRTVGVGSPLTLTASAADPDNLPARRPAKPPTGTDAAAVLYRPPQSIVPSSGPGLRLSWIVFRGLAKHVRFDPEQMKTWTDTRAWANSPWSPPFDIPEPPANNTWVTRATFDQPGTYTLRAVASDGALFTYANVDVTVNR